MSLGEILLKYIWAFCLNNSIELIGLSIVFLFVLDFYNSHVRVNRNTDHIDLMDRYIQLQLHRKYREKF